MGLTRFDGSGSGPRLEVICLPPVWRRQPSGNVGIFMRPQRLLRDLAQDRCLARLGPGARRDAPTLRLPTGVMGVALSWPAVSQGPVRGEARKGFAQLEVAVPSLPDVTR